MKAFFIERSSTGNRLRRMENVESGTGTRSGTSELLLTIVAKFKLAEFKLEQETIGS